MSIYSANRYNWAYRTVCRDCDIVDLRWHHTDGSNFWANGCCYKCGKNNTVAKCRFVRKRIKEFVWWKPSTWNAYVDKVEYG